MLITVKPRRKKLVVLGLVFCVVAYLLVDLTSVPSDHRRKARWVLARAEADTSVQSIQSFHNDYGILPKTYLPTSELFNILMAKDSEAANKLNPRRICYLTFRANRIKDGVPLDPFGHPYHVAIATNDSRTITVGGVTHKQTVLVWSSGPNGMDESGGGDDISSDPDENLRKKP